ncbi:MAG: hypothetical protein IJQ73_17065 [Kiritimatiellae bacterium]|nr:hypothetical protein [Kiritimatiellia bacterium]
MNDEVKPYDALLCRQVLRQALTIAGIILLSRFTRNWAVAGLAVYGIWSALKQRPGPTLIVYLLLSFLPMISPAIMPRYSHFTAIARLSTLAMTCALILTGDNRDGRHQIPLGSIYLFLLMAALSSIEGYCPVISHLKIVNFFIFITGIYIGTKNIHRCPDAIRQIRCTFLAIIVLLVYGSLATLPLPSIAYYTSMRSIVQEFGFTYADEIFAGSVGQSLFTGITVHSQFLGPTVACCFAWLLCDMLIVERKVTSFHLALLLPIPVMAYMTRSRLAFLVLAFSIVLVAFYCVPNARVVSKVRARFSNIMLFVIVLMLGAAVAFEIQGGYVSRWLRKTNDVASDARSLGEAVTGSRQGKIAECLNDFHQNTLFGKGFQVDRTTQHRFEAGQISIFSAAIEKGLLPLMVLGETGILGTVAFVLFLLVFFTTCHQRHYTATLTLFCVYLSTNLAEATFFAPSGSGGVQWILMVVGGFVIDMNREAEKRAESAGDTLMQAPPSPLLPLVEEGTELGDNIDGQLAPDDRGEES